MYVVPPHQTSVTLFSRDGSVRLFKSRRDALRALGATFIRREVGPSFHAPRPDPGLLRFQRDGVPILGLCLCDHVLLDDTGRSLRIHDFSDMLPSRTYRLRLGEHGVQHPGRKRSGYNYWRHLRTTAERRQNELVLSEEGEPSVRGSRRPGNLPSTWDDTARHVDRSWKSQRKTQVRNGVDRRSHPRNGGGQ